MGIDRHAKHAYALYSGDNQHATPSRLYRQLFALAVSADLREIELHCCKRALRRFWVQEVARGVRSRLSDARHRRRRRYERPCLVDRVWEEGEVVTGFGETSNRTAVFVGDGSLLINCAEMFMAAGHTVAGVSTRSPATREWAESRGLQLLGAPSELDLADLEIDYLFSVANLEILPGPVLSAPKRLAINFHDSPLPRYAGLNAPAWALMDGESAYGITWHEMTAAVDGGRILWQTHFAVAPDETAYSLNTKCYAVAAESFAAFVDDLTNDRLLLKDQVGEPSRFFGSQRPRCYGLIDFAQGAEDIARLVRALDNGVYDHPLGRAKLQTADGVLAVVKAVAENEAEAARPGTVLSERDGTIRIATGRGAIASVG